MSGKNKGWEKKDKKALLKRWSKGRSGKTSIKGSRIRWKKEEKSGVNGRKKMNKRKLQDGRRKIESWQRC